MEGTCCLLLSREIILVLGRRTKKQVRMAFFFFSLPTSGPINKTVLRLAVKSTVHRSGGKSAGSRVRQYMVEDQCVRENSVRKRVRS